MNINLRPTPLMALLFGFLLLSGCSKSTDEVKTSNGAIQFDGVDDYIDLGNIYDGVALPVTISSWVWLDPAAGAGSMPIFDSQVGEPLYHGFQMGTSITSNLGATYGDGQGENNIAYRRSKSSLFSPIMGRWVNLTVVIRGAADMSLYFNGVDVGGNYEGTSNLPMSNNSSTENALVGYNKQNGITYFFKGKLDELKIWNRSLTADEIQSLIFKKLDATSTGLIGYWNFDETSGDKVLDKSSGHYDGALKGNPTRVVSDVPIN